MDHASLIDKLGGYAVVSQDLAMPEQRVRFWHRRQNIPSRYWDPILRLAKRRHIQLTERMLLHGAKTSAAA